MLNAFAPYPFFEGLTYIEELPDFGANVTYGINDVMSLLCFNRVYLFLRFYLYWTNFQTPRAARVCGFYHERWTTFFSVKCVMK